MKYTLHSNKYTYVMHTFWVIIGPNSRTVTLRKTEYPYIYLYNSY